MINKCQGEENECSLKILSRTNLISRNGMRKLLAVFDQFIHLHGLMRIHYVVSTSFNPFFCPFSCYKINIPHPIFLVASALTDFYFVLYCSFGFDRKILFPLVFPKIAFPQFEHPYTTVIWFSSWIGSGLPVSRTINYHFKLIVSFSSSYWDFQKRLVKPPLRQNL